jgi:hypothetical protein
MAKQITIDGVKHSIQDRFHRDHLAQLRRRDFRMEAVRNEIVQLEQASNRRQLSDEEEARKDALVKVWNIGNANAMLQGRPLSDFGFTTSCQVHVQRHGLHCGCVLQTVFDHHLGNAGKPHDHHAHHPWRTCGRHRGINDFREHRRAALRDHEVTQQKIEEEAAAAADQ